MGKILKFEVKRMFRSKTLYAAIFIGVILGVWLLEIEVKEMLQTNEIISLYGIEKMGLYYPRSVFNSFIGLEYAYLPSSMLYSIFPVLVVLPYAITFYQDKKSGYLKNILLCCTRKQYYVAKYITVAASGIIVVGAILIFSLIISMMVFPFLSPELSTNLFSPMSAEQMWTELFVKSPFIYTLLYCVIDAVFFSLIAELSLLASTWMKNSMSVFLFPMLSYFIVGYMLSELGLEKYNPLAFLRPCQIAGEADFIVILIEAIVLFLITSIGFVKIGARQDVF